MLTGTTLAILLIAGAVIFALLCILIFAVGRKKPGKTCDLCGAEILESWAECPYCTNKGSGEGENLSENEKSIAEKGSNIESEFSGEKNTVKLGSVQTDKVLAYLIVKEGSRAGYSHQLTDKVTTLGRDSENIISLNDDSVSGKHAKILLENKKFYIHDLASTNGTTLNGKKIVREEIIDGDEILLGKTVFAFKTV